MAASLESVLNYTDIPSAAGAWTSYLTELLSTDFKMAVSGVPTANGMICTAPSTPAFMAAMVPLTAPPPSVPLFNAADIFITVTWMLTSWAQVTAAAGTLVAYVPPVISPTLDLAVKLGGGIAISNITALETIIKTYISAMVWTGTLAPVSLILV